MPFLSVIVPVYNVEKYLRNCIESVISQGFQDLEVILVDDGSSDDSVTICDYYAARNQRVKVIHKTNGGLSSARNVGIMNSSGKYITFLDSDDAWSLGQLDKVISIVQSEVIDLLVFSTIDKVSDGSLYIRNDSFKLDNSKLTLSVSSYYSLLIKSGNLRESACTKLIKRSFLIKHNLFFQDKLISEDTEWMLRVLRCISYVTLCDIPLLICTFGRIGSISNTAGKRSASDLLKIIKQSIEFYDFHPHASKIKSYELQHCAYLLSITMGIYGGLNEHEKNELKDKIGQYKYLLDTNNCNKVRLVRICCRLVGINVTCKVLSIYMYFNKTKLLNRKRINE